MSIDLISLWHSRARPNPSHGDMNKQLGCHFEEVAEMLEELCGDDEYSHELLTQVTAKMHKIAEALKSGTASVGIRDRRAVLDALCDQIVTATGVAHCARMNITEGVRRVNTSNWTKYDHEGKPIFDRNGKITKGPNYTPPDLTGLY